MTMRVHVDEKALDAGELIGPSLVQEVSKRLRAHAASRGHTPRPGKLVAQSLNIGQEIYWDIPDGRGLIRGVMVTVRGQRGSSSASMDIGFWMPALRTAIVWSLLPFVVVGAIAGGPFMGLLPGELQVLPLCFGAIAGLVGWFVFLHFGTRWANGRATDAEKRLLDDVKATVRELPLVDER
jgi:hypothetical protein